jgi:hypothetical protein
MLRQTIKNWLHKMVAWWPWKQSTKSEHSHVTNPLNKGSTKESLSRSTIDGSVPQAGIAPRLSTIEEHPERVVQSDFLAASELTETALPPLSSPVVEMTKEPPTHTDEASVVLQPSPSPQQRLEFLQYLIKRGIVNEGFEENR